MSGAGAIIAPAAPMTSSGSTGDAEAAIEFLRLHRPGGPWVVMSIVPDGPTRTITVETEEAVRDFVHQYDGRRNLYFMVNPANRRLTSKATKNDVEVAEFVIADLDPDKHESPEAAKARYLAGLQTFGLRPTFLINSGNGLQAIWRLAVPLGPGAFDQVQDVSKAVMVALGSAAGTQNVDRVFRLPGTTNIPNKAKLARGRVPCPTALIQHNSESYPIEAFKPFLDAAAEKGATKAKGHDRAAEKAMGDEASPPIDVANLPAVDVDALEITERVRGLIRTGEDPEDKLKDKTRSAAFWAALLGLVGKCDDATVAAIMLDPALPIGAHIRDQRNPVQALTAQISKARAQVVRNDKSHPRPEPVWEPVFTRCSEIIPEPIKWLWPARFALGKVSLIAGHPGLGKSQLVLDLAARVTTGGAWPCATGTAPLGNVVVLSAEDDIKDTIRPRLDAARADVSRVVVLEAIRQSDGEGRRCFDLTRDMEMLEKEVRLLGDVRLVIIDPISAYMGQPGKMDTHRNTDVRSTLAPLQDLAAQLSIAVIFVSHLTKGSRDGAINRVTGSGAFVAAARAAYLVEKETEKEENEDGEAVEVDTGRRFFLPIKNNLGDDKMGFVYKIVQRTTVYETLTPPMEIRAPAIEWEDETVSKTADQALAPTSPGSSGASKACAFLEKYLADGPRPQKQIVAAALERGLSEDQLKRAKKKLGLDWWREGFGKGGEILWALPGDTRGTQEELHPLA
jgi:hypothetical protein